MVFTIASGQPFFEIGVYEFQNIEESRNHRATKKLAFNESSTAIKQFAKILDKLS